jgi:2-keto-4-pentenoate hydratase
MTVPSAVAQSAEAIWAARQAGLTLDAEATIGSPELATAYAIQLALLALRLAAGERVVGWKLGYTAEVMRRQMGIDRPNIGPLTDWMLLKSEDLVSDRFVQPRVEPEIGLRLHTALDARRAPVDRHTVAAAVEGAYACLEVVHSTWTGYRFNLAQNTADNASAGQVVVGPRLPVTDLMALDTVSVRLSDGAQTLDHGVGADADGHPLDALVRLARELARIDRRLEPGDLVITGGLTAAHPLAPGDRLLARFSAGDTGSINVSVRRRSDGSWQWFPCFYPSPDTTRP